MAKLSSDGKYVVVERGDTLSEIARDYGKGKTYKQLAAINNIPNPDRIYVNQKIYLTKDGGTSSVKTNSNSNKPTINQFGEQSDAEGVLFATWSWGKANTESYKALWTYDTGGGIWFEGSNSTITVDKDAPELSRQSVYNIPANAKKVRFKVKPISAKKTVNNKETRYWEANWSDLKTWTDSTPLEAPGIPDVVIETLKLTATLDNITINATEIEFEIVKDNAAKVYKTGKAKIVTTHAAFSCVVDEGGEYKVRCRACKGTERSDWSNYSANVGSAPAAPSGITELRATEVRGVIYLAWGEVKSATTYDIEYADNKNHLGSSNLSTIESTNDNTPNYTFQIEEGKEYFFRVRAVNGAVKSGWCESKSIVIGETPAAPTTWSLTSSVIVGEELKLYWVHNSIDGSDQTYANIRIVASGEEPFEILEPNRLPDDKKGGIHEYSLDTSGYTEGTEIRWSVQTAGVTNTFGDWSVPRTVNVYQKPYLYMELMDASSRLIDTVTTFPFKVGMTPGPPTQAPIAYNVTICSNETYESVDNIGNPKTIAAGDAVYSGYFPVGIDMVDLTFSAGDIDLENNISYTLKAIVSMNSGLTAESTIEFAVGWEDTSYEPNAEISIDTDSYTAAIRPYCVEYSHAYHIVTKSGRTYTKTNEIVEHVLGEAVRGTVTTTGEAVHRGIDGDGNDIYYCEVQNASDVEGVTLSVYRREFDGRFTELATGLANTYTTIIDPHPSLDYARYRIVATSIDTGAVCFTDLPGYPVGGNSIVIQWDEDWTDFEVDETSVMEQPPWAGSLLKLPYNVDVSDNVRPDVALVEYIGRAHPVSYYGTQVGAAASWSTEIDKNDKETLYALRRLAKWMGDVYVREPSGSGYWANVTVSFSQKHCDVTIPVNFDVTRVEGGI